MGLKRVVVMGAVSDGGVRRSSRYTARGNPEARGKGEKRCDLRAVPQGSVQADGAFLYLDSGGGHRALCVGQHSHILMP